MGLLLFIIMTAFTATLIGFFAIRRFWWIAVWMVCVLFAWEIFLWQMQAQHIYGMGEAFLYTFVWFPSLLGALIGLGVACLLRTRRGPGDIVGMNAIWAGGSFLILAGLTFAFVTNL